MKLSSQKGISLLELMVGVGLTGVVAIILFSLLQFAEKETKLISEDIQTMILKFGATKVMQRDFSNAYPSFNYLEVNDDNSKPFLVLSQNEYCQSNCSRQLTLNIPTGAIHSDKVLYLIVVKGYPGERLKFSIDPYGLFNPTTKLYKYINAFVGDNDYTISKSKRPESPWAAGRMILLNSEINFYDCLSGINGPLTVSCALNLKNSTDGNYAIKRPFKMLGIVNTAEEELEFFEVAARPDLLRKEYKTCRADKNINCTSGSINDLSGENAMKTAKVFFENLPILPGHDNGAYLQPVELIRYHLERPSPNAPDTQIQLMRSTASFNGTKLSFDRAHLIMSGVKNVIFTRKNISNSVIEFKIIEANGRVRIK